jgi:hypothetical protein
MQISKKASLKGDISSSNSLSIFLCLLQDALVKLLSAFLARAVMGCFKAKNNSPLGAIQKKTSAHTALVFQCSIKLYATLQNSIKPNS